MKNTYTSAIVLLLLSIALSTGCSDKKASFIAEHNKVYETVLKSDYSALEPLLTERSRVFVEALHSDEGRDLVTKETKDFDVEAFVHTYLTSYPSASSGDDLLTYLGLREISIFGYSDPYFTIETETQVAPSPFADMYRTLQGIKRLTWLKYE